MSSEVASAIEEKVNEYRVLVGPVEHALREMQLMRGMLRARAEDELHALSPTLAAISETLGISVLDLLLSNDRDAFLREAVLQASLPIETIRERILTAAGAGSGEQLRALGLPEASAV